MRHITFCRSALIFPALPCPAVTFPAMLCCALLCCAVSDNDRVFLESLIHEAGEAGTSEC